MGSRHKFAMHNLAMAALAVLLAVSVIAAANSPLLAWRSPVYIAAGFAGVFAMCLLLLQPLIAGRFIGSLSPLQERRYHRLIGVALVISLVVHLVGLWVTSPPDVIDALLFVSPTPFSVWGVTAMWSVLITAGLAFFRRKIKLSAAKWRLIHKFLAIVTVVGSVVHALMIEGTMELISKTLLCIAVIIVTAMALYKTTKS